MIQVAGYCRVSTDKADQVNSFDAQQRYFRSYIQDHPDWELYEIYADEGISGTGTKKRPQFNRMMDDAYEGRFQLIITKEVSRFSRNILDTIRFTRDLRAIGIGIIFATDRINTLEPEAEMLLSFLASLAQEESRRTSSRVVWGQSRQMERGVVFGHSLLGYDVKDGTLTINPEGAELVRLIFHKYAVEQVSTAEISRFLTENGYRTYRNQETWNPKSIVKLLKNEKYAGDLVQKKTYTPDFLTHAKRTNHGQVPFVTIHNHHEPIISREVWDLAQKRLRQNNKHTNGSHSNRYVFSGKIKCGECGSNFVGRFKYLQDGTKIRRWHCGKATKEGSASCRVGKIIRDDDAMLMLHTAIRSLSIDVDAIINTVSNLAWKSIQDSTITDDQPHRLEKQIKYVLQKKEAVMDSFFSGELAKEDMHTFIGKYDAQLEDLYQRQKNAVLQNKDLQTLRAAIQQTLYCILDGTTESEAFHKTILESLTVFQDRHMELRLHHLPQIFQFVG